MHMQSQASTAPAQTIAPTAADWDAELAAVRERMHAAGAGPGMAQPDQVAGNTGLELMQAMLAGELPYPHIAQTLDFSIVEVAHGHAVFKRRPELMHYNPLGSVHDGWLATLLDSALGCAAHRRPERQGVSARDDDLSDHRVEGLKLIDRGGGGRGRYRHGTIGGPRLAGSHLPLCPELAPWAFARHQQSTAPFVSGHTAPRPV